MEDFLSTKINTNELNFCDPLPMLKINTFSSAAKKIEVKATNDKIITLTADREFFGRLLVIAKQRDIDLQEVVSYELSAVPVAIAHGDRSLRKTTKSSLMSVLEKNVAVLPSLPPSLIPGCQVPIFPIFWPASYFLLFFHEIPSFSSFLGFNYVHRNILKYKK